MSDEATLWLIGGWVEMVTLSPLFTFPSNYITNSNLTKCYPLGFGKNTSCISISHCKIIIFEFVEYQSDCINKLITKVISLCLGVDCNT